MALDEAFRAAATIHSLIAAQPPTSRTAADDRPHQQADTSTGDLTQQFEAKGRAAARGGGGGGGVAPGRHSKEGDAHRASR